MFGIRFQAKGMKTKRILSKMLFLASLGTLLFSVLDPRIPYAQPHTGKGPANEGTRRSRRKPGIRSPRPSRSASLSYEIPRPPVEGRPWSLFLSGTGFQPGRECEISVRGKRERFARVDGHGSFLEVLEMAPMEKGENVLVVEARCGETMVKREIPVQGVRYRG